MSLTAVATASATIPPAVSTLYNALTSLFTSARDLDNAGVNSLPSHVKTGRISSRVYIDASVVSDPVITDILKTVHTQYCAFILAALQMNQFVSSGITVQNLLKVVATEDNNLHRDISLSFGTDSDRLAVDDEVKVPTIDDVRKKIKNHQDKVSSKPEDKNKKKSSTTTGKIISFSGDDHIPSGKIIEVTLINPDNPEHKITINLLVQLAPYIVPEALAVQFIVKDNVPSFYQRIIQWRTGEISFWKDLILWSDIAKHREKLLKLDPTGMFADMMQDQQKNRSKTLMNFAAEKDNRARNIANSVLIFSQDTVTRAKAESGIDFEDYTSRQRYFTATFAMMVVVVDNIYNHVTFYYNGIQDSAVFSFDQMKVAGKGNSTMDLVSIMNALSQGKSPKF